MKSIIYIAGIHSIAFAIFHICFWKIFNWKKTLKKSSKIDAGIIQVLNLKLIYIFLGISLICFVFAEELFTSSLGNAILFGCSLFWMLRIVEQFIFFKENNTFSKILILLFFIGAFLFLFPVLTNLYKLYTT